MNLYRCISVLDNVGSWFSDYTGEPGLQILPAERATCWVSPAVDQARRQGAASRLAARGFCMARKGVSFSLFHLFALWVTAVSACVVHFQPVGNVTIGLGSFGPPAAVGEFLNRLLSWFVLLVPFHTPHPPLSSKGLGAGCCSARGVAVERAELLGLVSYFSAAVVASRSRGLSSSEGLVCIEGMETVVLDTGGQARRGDLGSLACGNLQVTYGPGWSLLIHTCVSTED